MLFFIDFALGAHHDAAAAGLIRLDDAVYAIAGGGRGEVGAFDIFHQFLDGAVGVLHAPDRGVDGLAEVVRRDVGGHAHGDAHRAVDQEVGEAGGQHGRLAPTVVEVRHKRHDLFFKVGHHLVGDLREARLGITVGGGGVAIDRAEVAVALDQGIAHGKILRHAHHGAVNGRVAVRVITTQHVAHGGGRFAERLVAGQVILIHGVHDAALTRLHAVAHVGQGAGHDDGHGVFDEGLLHPFFHVDIFDALIRKSQINIFVLVVFHSRSLSFLC